MPPIPADTPAAPADATLPSEPEWKKWERAYLAQADRFDGLHTEDVAMELLKVEAESSDLRSQLAACEAECVQLAKERDALRREVGNAADIMGGLLDFGTALMIRCRPNWQEHKSRALTYIAAVAAGATVAPAAKP